MRWLPILLVGLASFALTQDTDEKPVNLTFHPKANQTYYYKLRIRTIDGDSNVLMSATQKNTIASMIGNGGYVLTPSLMEVKYERAESKNAKATSMDGPDRTGLSLLFSPSGVIQGHVFKNKDKDKDPDDYALQRYFYAAGPSIPVVTGVEWNTEWQSSQYPSVPKVSVKYVMTGYTDWNKDKCAVVQITTTEGDGKTQVTGTGKCLIEVGSGLVCTYLITLYNVVIPGTKSRGTLTCYKEIVEDHPVTRSPND